MSTIAPPVKAKRTRTRTKRSRPAVAAPLHNRPTDDKSPPVTFIEEIYSPAIAATMHRRGTAPSPRAATENPFTLPRLERATPSNLSKSPLARFFAQYQGVLFRYDPGVLPMLEYNRLLRVLTIPRDGPMAKSMFKKFAKAMVDEFGTRFGTGIDDLAAWQRLCKRIGINPIPTALHEARAEFKKTHVNLVELMMFTRIADGEMKKFDTEEELAFYTRSMPGRTFPRWAVPKGSLLEHLLRHIWN